MGVGTFDDLDGEAVEMSDGGLQFRPAITAFGEEAAQGRIGVPAAFDEAGRTITVLDVGGMDQGVEQVAGRIGRDMALAALNSLAGIIAARPTGFGGLHRLAVDDARSRFDLAAFRDLHFSHQHRVDRVEQGAVAHPVEMVLHRRERRKGAGQLRPLAPRRR